MDKIEQAQGAEAKSVSVIAANLTITGNVEVSDGSSEADLQIEGTIKGDVHCGTVILTENSTVAGNISADRVRVSGNVDGAITTSDLAVESTARVSGELVYERLRIAAGAIVQGNLKWRGAEQADGSRLKLVDQASVATPQAVWID
jgi:cytoskeletal protein CcmA (bactofilin family)